MFRFVLGFLSIMLAIFLWDVGVGIESRTVQAERLAKVMALLCLIPALAAWGTARTIHTLSPRRVFDGVLAHRLMPLLLGCLAACTTIAATSATVVWLTPAVSGLVSFSVLSAAITGCLVLLCRRRRAGSCRGCGYDISASLEFGRCPECGGQLCG